MNKENNWTKEKKNAKKNKTKKKNTPKVREEENINSYAERQENQTLTQGGFNLP